MITVHPLPETFPASSPDTTYTASWVDGYIVTIKGDERTEIAENTFKANLNPIQTWNYIAVHVKAKVSLKSEWQGGDYEVYEWRLGDENGQKLTDDYRIDKHITVYAVTNYNKFNIDSTRTKIEIRSDKGYSGGKPKGKIIIPDGITEIAGSSEWNKGAFSNCAEITSVKFPQGLTKIGSSAFAGCTGLRSINLPESLNQIGEVAFYGCKGLTSINLPKGLTQIGFGAFAGCTGLTSLTVDSDNTVYKAEHNIVYTKDGKTLVCAAGGLTSATILDTVTAISKAAFADCTGLTSIDLSGLASLNQIGEHAFYSCTGLTSINLPASLTKIGDYAFVGCTGLRSINLSASLTKIGEFAFSGCTGLRSINLPASLTQIDDSAFYECTGLTSAVFEDKTGWAVYDNDTYTGTSTPVNLDDASTAAKYLREETDKGGYSDKYWKKN